MNTTTRKAVWFSRHQPTADQIEDALSLGFAIEAIEMGIALGSRDIQTMEDLGEVLSELRALVDKTGAEAVFGVFPAPVASSLYMELCSFRPESRRVPLYAAWNVSRTPEGGKPTFQHKCWMEVGQLRLWLMAPDMEEISEALS